MAVTLIVPKISDLRKKTIQAIINVFETGRPRGNYGAVTLLREMLDISRMADRKRPWPAGTCACCCAIT